MSPANGWRFSFQPADDDQQRQDPGGEFGPQRMCGLLHMTFDGVGADAQLLGDLLVTESLFAAQRIDGALPWRQRSYGFAVQAKRFPHL